VPCSKSADGTKLIPTSAAANKIGCTPKMLQDWIKDYDHIAASSKHSRKNRCNASAQEPELELSMNFSYKNDQLAVRLAEDG